MRIQAQGGDWGLDTIVGDLGDGVIEAFQAKFFIDGIDGPQQAQIRKSFDAAIVGRENGHELASWTLCIPVGLNPGPHVGGRDGRRDPKPSSASG